MDKEKLMEFAGEQCKIFPENSEMGKYLRETLKILQESPCEDAVSRKDMYFKLTNGAYPNETTEQFIDRLVKELEDMPPATPTQRWIHVSEEYPNIEDEYKYFLVTDEKGKVSVQQFLLSLDEEPQPYFSGMVNVIAWMPLPKPYQEEKKFCSDCKHHTDGEEIHGATPCGSCGVDKKNFE